LEHSLQVVNLGGILLILTVETLTLLDFLMDEFPQFLDDALFLLSLLLLQKFQFFLHPLILFLQEPSLIHYGAHLSIQLINQFLLVHSLQMNVFFFLVQVMLQLL